MDGRDARCSTELLGFGWLGRRRLILTILLDPLVALRAQFKEGLGVLVQALTLRVVEHRFPQNAVRRLGTEIIGVVKLMDRFENLVGGRPGY